MRFATYEHDGIRRCGAVSTDASGADRLHPLPAHVSLLDLVRAGRTALLDAGQAALAEPAGPAAADVHLLPPVQPGAMRDFVTFEEHGEGMLRRAGLPLDVPEAWRAAPTFYFTNPYSAVGAHDDIPVPPGSSLLDFELEVAAVIGAEGRDLTPEQARDHIIGYTVFNDWSARDLQTREMQAGLGPAKGKDTATTLGPYLVTADELEPYRDEEGFLALALTAEVNGQVVGKDMLSNMSWTFEEMAAYASRGTVVRPGDVLGSGTCGNGGCLAELWGINGSQTPPPLQPGDVVTLTVQGIGQVSNRVVRGKDPHPLPTARKRPRNRP
ncbi:fumarylacetoacetate hydrolase family protein [Streptomyces mangrovisoli]|uniref:Hydroxylase n=1 Tax=Streptomyces mangrovisoli TaxID=1428628 RepID=A0A1J4NW84_9ACTN|nr:fumarylacetoacetate hydrolase family protein [Streptomyces mangrovisoli]OIJ65493.1 hydroxylase [Streptomyces mangrovisoli]